MDIPGQKQTESALDTIASQGVLGSLCVLLMVALFVTVRALLKAKDDRIHDQRLMTDTISRHNDAAKDLAIEMNKSASHMLVEQNRSLDIVKNTLNTQDKTLESLRTTITGLTQEQIGLKASMVNLKCTNGRS